jgi:cell division initiation protein
MTAISNGPNVKPTLPRLTPERVRKMQFTRTQIGRRGLAEDEVNLFLERVAEDIAARDAEDASMRAMVLHYQNTLADWRAEYRDPQSRSGTASGSATGTGTGVMPSVEAVNILSRAQQEADSYVAQTQAYCRRLAVDARDHAQQILTEAQAQAEEAANRAVQGYRARSGDAYTPEFEELERRLAWARTFLSSLESVEAQLRTAREALSYEFDRLGSPGNPPNHR